MAIRTCHNCYYIIYLLYYFIYFRFFNKLLRDFIRCCFKGYYANSFDNPYTWLWIVASVVSSCYAYTWDIKMDWGLFDKNAGENTFLREEVVYSSTVSCQM